MQKSEQKWPFLVWFGLNLGLNNLKFDQEAIFDWIASIGLTWLDRLDGSTRSDWLQKWPFLVWFGLNLGLNNWKFDQEAIFDWIDLIGSTQLDWLDQIVCKNGFLVEF